MHSLQHKVSRPNTLFCESPLELTVHYVGDWLSCQRKPDVNILHLMMIGRGIPSFIMMPSGNPLLHFFLGIFLGTLAQAEITFVLANYKDRIKQLLLWKCDDPIPKLRGESL